MVKREPGKVTPAPVSAPGEPHPGEGKRQGGPPGGGFFGSARPPASAGGGGGEGAPVGEEAGP